VVPSLIPRPPIPTPPFIVAGLGRAGTAAVQALCERVGPEQVWAWDANTGRAMRRVQRKLEAEGVRTWLGAMPGRRQVRWARCVVKSPGISFHDPLIQRVRAAGLEVIDELELGWRLRRIPTLAVTGTNGKSTVAGLVTAALSAAGCRVQLAGNTQFGPPLSAAAESLDWIVCEVSSFQLEGCAQLLPEIGVFTNLTPEHLGRHRTMERYGECKRRLFIRNGLPLPRAVIDIDGAFGHDLAADVERRGGRVTRVGFSEAADYRVEAVQSGLRETLTQLRTPSGRLTLNTALPGAYNARNIAAALAAADLLGVERRISTQTVAGYEGPPGRFEHIAAGQPFDVIVDFAHTPDALEQLLRAVGSAKRSGTTLTVVLGLGFRPGAGMRDMGRLARRFSDQLILTTSGFRGLAPLPCLLELLRGARTTSGGEIRVILDRRHAIRQALQSAGAGDVIVIPGRGALPEMLFDVRGVAMPFDDREVARDLLGELAPEHAWGQASPRNELRRSQHARQRVA
jgi:UDP-N-acetylmuramoyl-L-alanyl-D-glutamate--2,6-diaminopimelate ligase